MIWPFHRRTPADAARELAAIRYHNERERIRATTRQLCHEIGKPVPEALAS
jgi:hypothetical protein